MNSFDKSILNQITDNLAQFKYSNNVYNFRCLYCGDSATNKNKARGYIFTTKTNSLVVKCHNCSIAVSFEHFLEDHFPTVYKDYKFNKYLEKYTLSEPIQIVSAKIHKPEIFSDFKTVQELHKNHRFKLYIKSRKIPEKHFQEIFLVADFKKFTNTLIPNKFIQPQYQDSRLTVPLILNGELIGYQGRTIEPNSNLRYITIMLDNIKPKVWGFDKIDQSKPVYVTEGIFDAMFVDNAIAMLGADLSLEFLQKYPNIKFVFIFDNEPRNMQIVNRMQKVIELGYSIAVWKKYINSKDINDYILSGGTACEITQNIFSGISAKLEINQWRK